MNKTRLIDFIEHESSESHQQLFFMAATSGVANGLLLTIINHASEVVAHNEDITQYFLAYMVTFVLFLYAQWFAFDRAVVLIEEAQYRIRTRLSHKISQVQPFFIEDLGADNLYARLTRNDTFISQAIPQIVATAQMSILILFSFLYLAHLSPLSLLITVVTIALGWYVFHAQTHAIRQSLDATKRKETLYFRAISDMIHGLKEIKLNQRKSEHLLERVELISDQAKGLKIDAGRREARIWGFGRVFVYALLPVLVFIVPSFSQEQTDDIYKITAALLFITGPIGIVVNMMPILNRVDRVIGDMKDLEQEMDTAGADILEPGHADFMGFQTLALNDVHFAYPDSQDFATGPFNESLKRGELLFIVGGNGSGKSTLLKLLVGLYQPASGTLSIDGQALPIQHYPDYRELFAIVFTDFHLFEKLYGIDDLDADQVNRWLEKMQLSHKVQFRNGRFSTTQLSTGQRKRLAFIAAVLEDKPILVIDEFAADQDPQFRRYFYETLLPELKSMGKTVIAVTHDDHYFHIADRVLKMTDGQIEPVSMIAPTYTTIEVSP